MSERLEEAMERLKDEYKVPKNIHDENAIRFFDHVLGAEKSTLELLQKGFRLDRNSLPKHYMEKNNRTAREDLDFCLKKTLEYIEKGSVEEVGIKPIFVNPLSMAKKYVCEEEEYKKRLVLDLSRSLNKYQAPRTYKPDNLDRLECLFSLNNYAVTLDLASAYHHVMLKTATIFLGSQFMTKDRERIVILDFNVYLSGYRRPVSFYQK